MWSKKGGYLKIWFSRYVQATYECGRWHLLDCSRHQYRVLKLRYTDMPWSPWWCDRKNETEVYALSILIFHIVNSLSTCTVYQCGTDLPVATQRIKIIEIHICIESLRQQSTSVALSLQWTLYFWVTFINVYKVFSYTQLYKLRF